MTCSTCKHEFRSSCLHLDSTMPLDETPSPCAKYDGDPAKVEAAHIAATRVQAPLRGPEAWLSEQTLLQLRPRNTHHERMDER